jgi:hypothetical protein
MNLRKVAAREEDMVARKSAVFIRESQLRVLPTPCIVPAGVFDAYSWHESSELLLRMPASGLAQGAALSDENPPEMAFLFHGPEQAWLALPRELASFHAPSLSRNSEYVLAPYAIDDATDAFYIQNVNPSEQLLLATTTLRGVFWGLHDWCHFHNHGAFEERALTELQCDVTALTWLHANADILECSAEGLQSLATRVIAVSETRFREEAHVPESHWHPWLNAAFEPFLTR